MLVADSDAELAALLAAEAGRRLLELRMDLTPDNVEILRARADRAAHEYLVSALAEARPADPVLSEEGDDDPRRLRSGRVWIVDPLDGTREFGEPGRTDWAVHVALWQEGTIRAAAVSLPARAACYRTDQPPAIPVSGHQPPRVVVSRTRAPALVHTVARELSASLQPYGSAGAKTLAVVLGEAELYVHAGRMREWDAAAPAAVAISAGLHVSRFDGSALSFNTPDALVTELLVCRPELVEPALAALAVATA
jgi:3'(2'), 5'-bisphosphate nucleotidase